MLRGMDADALPVRIVSCGHYHTDRAWRLDGTRTRTWTDFDLWLLIDGAGSVSTPEGVFPLLPGTCLIMRGGEAYEMRPGPARLRHSYVHFDWLRDGRPLPTDHGDLPPRHRRLLGHRLVAELLERVVADHRAGETARAARWLEAALLEVARQDRGPAGTDPRARAIDELCARLRDEPTAAWRIARCAGELGIGADRFARLFRARAGCAPRAFLARARLDHACTLLRESSAPIADIARQCGYDDPHFFSRHFARHHGRPPGSFRREARARR